VLTLRAWLAAALAAVLVAGCGGGATEDAVEVPQDVGDAADVLAALADPDTAEDGALALLAGLGVGVYTGDGRQVQAGSETGEDDFWLYDFQVPMVAALAEAQPRPFADLVELLRAAGLDMTGDELAAAYREVYAEHPDAFLVQVLEATGVQFAADAELTALQEWLLLLDTVVPPNRTEVAAAGWPLLMAPVRLAQTGCAGPISGPALSGWGYVFGARDVGEVVEAEERFRQINRLLFMTALDVRLGIEPDRAHEGHGELGEEAELTVTVVSHFQPQPEPVSCGHLTLVGYPGYQGPLANVEVQWFIPGLLEERGTVRGDGGMGLERVTHTDEAGTTRLVFQAQQEEADGHGLHNEEIAVVRALVDVRTALRAIGFDPLFTEFLGPVPVQELITVEWHETDGSAFMSHSEGGGTFTLDLWSCGSLRGPWQGTATISGAGSGSGPVEPFEFPRDDAVLASTSWSFSVVVEDVTVQYSGQFSVGLSGEPALVIEGITRVDPPGFTQRFDEARIDIATGPDSRCQG
jgi:hypothetical protein